MRNELLFQNYRKLCIESFKVAQHVLGNVERVAWWDKTSDAEIRRRLRGHSGVDEGSGFADFTRPWLAPYFSAFIEEALKDHILSRLYSEKDLVSILIYQLVEPMRLLAFPDGSEEILVELYARFENLLYEEDWITATIYPLVNFYSKDGWEKRRLHKAAGLDDKFRFPGGAFQIDDNIEVKCIDFIASRLLDKPSETSGFRARSPYRDFTGDYYALEIQSPKRKSANSEHNLTSYLIGRPIGAGENDTSLENRAVVGLPGNLLLTLRLFRPGDVGIAPYRYISDYPKPLYIPDLYVQRYIELAQVEAYDGASYVLDPADIGYLKKLYSVVSNLLSDKPSELEHVDIAQRYFQYSYSYKLTDEARLQDRVISLIFALEALLLDRNEKRSKLACLGDILVGEKHIDKHIRVKTLVEEAYDGIRNKIAHGRQPTIKVSEVLVANLENCVRYAIRRVIGLAVGRGIRTKEDLRQAIINAHEENRRTKSERGSQRLRADADAPFL